MKAKYLKTSLLLAVTFVCVVSCTNKASNNSVNGHEFVDLGLSVMWATCNIGADSPSDYGDYFAWGETEPKSEYTEENSVTYGKSMGSIAGNPQYDAATANWGGTWRMPTNDEIDELIDKCKLTWIKQNGVRGCKVTGPNGNSIFLPAAGGCEGTSLEDAGQYGGYWSATSDESGTSVAYISSFSYELSGTDYKRRYCGLTIRPVTTSISKSTGYINRHGYVDLGLSVMWATCNIGANSPFDYGDYFAWGETEPKWEYRKDNSVTYGKEMGSIAGDPQYDAARANWGGIWRMPTKDEIDELKIKCEMERTTQDGVGGYKVTGPSGNSIFLPFAGGYCRDERSNWYADRYGGYWSATPNMHDSTHAYRLDISIAYFKPYALPIFRHTGLSVRPVISRKTKEITFSTISDPTGNINGHEYVDLGLSVKWATYNVGADSPSDYGDYFAWGETEPKSEYREENSVTYGKEMGSIAGDPQYDAAHANWGGTWRMPTWEEINELKIKCRKEWTTLEGHKGYKITGPNGNSIFLPAASRRNGTLLFSPGEDGHYWGATSAGSNMSIANSLDFGLNKFGRNGPYRYYGQTVRPVSE